MPGRESHSQVYFATAADDLVLVRIAGRATFDVSPRLAALMASFNRTNYSPQYILDLGECATLDSTFMGVIATLALHQSTCTRSHPVVVNANAVTLRQIDTMGLQYLLDVRSDPPLDAESVPDCEFRRVDAPRQSRVERLVHMIESHEALIDADSGNEIKFRPVLDSLQESLDRAKAEKRK